MSKHAEKETGFMSSLAVKARGRIGKNIYTALAASMLLGAVPKETSASMVHLDDLNPMSAAGTKNLSQPPADLLERAISPVDAVQTGLNPADQIDAVTLPNLRENILDLAELMPADASPEDMQDAVLSLVRGSGISPDLQAKVVASMNEKNNTPDDILLAAAIVIDDAGRYQSVMVAEHDPSLGKRVYLRLASTNVSPADQEIITALNQHNQASNQTNPHSFNLTPIPGANGSITDMSTKYAYATTSFAAQAGFTQKNGQKDINGSIALYDPDNKRGIGFAVGTDENGGRRINLGIQTAVGEESTASLKLGNSLVSDPYTIKQSPVNFADAEYGTNTSFGRFGMQLHAAQLQGGAANETYRMGSANQIGGKASWTQDELELALNFARTNGSGGGGNNAGIEAHYGPFSIGFTQEGMTNKSLDIDQNSRQLNLGYGDAMAGGEWSANIYARQDETGGAVTENQGFMLRWRKKFGEIFSPDIKKASESGSDTSADTILKKTSEIPDWQVGALVAAGAVGVAAALSSGGGGSGGDGGGGDGCTSNCEGGDATPASWLNSAGINALVAATNSQQNVMIATFNEAMNTTSLRNNCTINTTNGQVLDVNENLTAVNTTGFSYQFSVNPTLNGGNPTVFGAQYTLTCNGHSGQDGNVIGSETLGTGNYNN